MLKYYRIWYTGKGFDKPEIREVISISQQLSDLRCGMDIFQKIKT